MTAIKIQAFSGMIPIQDAQLLPDPAAAKAINAWLYSGNIEGMRDPVNVRTLANTSARRAFRIPIGTQVDKDHMTDSYWLEFNNQNVDVVKAPLDNDLYERFYWAGETDGSGSFPRYNTKARIAAGSSYYKLGVPSPGVAPVVTTSPVTGKFVCDQGTFRLSSVGAGLIYSKKSSSSTALDSGTFSIDGTRTVLVYRNASNVETPDSETASFIVDPTFNLLASGTVTDLLVTRAYVYTWVTTFGEEGPPSDPVIATGKQADHWRVTVTAPTGSDTTLRTLAKTRIYRTVTNAVGQADYYLVAEIDIGTLTYQDDVTDVDVAASANLESTFWTAPPTDMIGMASMPNGMVLGWRKNELLFCEPYRPHAWPATYALTTDFNIVGLGVVGQTAVVLTESGVYAVTGVNPSSMTMSTLALGMPCLSRGSIVNGAQSVYFATSNGIAAATPAGVQVITKTLVDKSYFLGNLKANSLFAAKLGESYFAGATVASGAFQADSFVTSAFEQQDFTGSYNGVLMDVTDPRMAWVEWTTAVPTQSLWTDPWSGEVLMVRGGAVYHFDVSTGHRQTFTWKSKVFHVEQQKNLAAMKIYFTVPSGALNAGTVKVYCDDRLVWTRPLGTSGEIMKMASGFKGEFWQVEISSDYIVKELHMASTTKELRSA